jgi:phosphate/sulfate permease
VGGIKNVNWWFFLRICVGWVVIFFVAVLLSAGVFAMFAYSPSMMYPEVNATNATVN